jgi:hypothetical protein
MFVKGIVWSDSVEELEVANENAGGTNPAGISLP